MGISWISDDIVKSKSKQKQFKSPLKAGSSSHSKEKDEAYLSSVIPKRISLFEAIKSEQEAHRLSIAGDTIKVTLPDGAVKEGKMYLSTPLDIAKEISNHLASHSLVSQVNGVLWDMCRPLEGDYDLKLFTFDTDIGRDTLWHSSAHILGQSLEMTYGCKLCIGPCTTRGEDLGKLVTSINNGILGKLSAPSASTLEAAKSRNISGITNQISSMSWADLPVDIFFIIFGFLHDINIHNVLDLYQCLAVCRSWRFVAKQIWQTCILPTTPWLLFHIDRSKKIFFKTNLYKCHEYPPSLATKDNDASLSCTLNLFHLQTYASYDGWLLLGNSDNLPFLYNPITTLLLQLPPLPRYRLLQFHMKFVSSGASPTDHNCIICIKFGNKREHMDYSNAFLAFCKPAVSTSWVVLEEEAEDIIFNGGKFYTIGSGGDLFVYNSHIINGNTSFCVGQPWKEIKIAEAVFNTKSLPWYGDDSCCFYLVESKHRELLMIMRTVDKKNYFTKSFRIFKLNGSNNNYYNGRRNYYYPYYWKEISSLPEKESIILLWNEGMSISVDDHNGYKSNSIYFYDEECWGRTTTCGIYELGSCKINHKTGDEACLFSKLFTPSKISNV